MGKFNNQRAAIKLMPNNDLEITGSAQNIQDLIENNKSQFCRGDFIGMDLVIHYPEKMQTEDVFITHYVLKENDIHAYDKNVEEVEQNQMALI